MSPETVRLPPSSILHQTVWVHPLLERSTVLLAVPEGPEIVVRTKPESNEYRS